MLPDLEIGGRLLLAAVLGGFIGLERESHGRPAGLRTHILVSLGACLVMLISIQGFVGTGRPFDPGRLAAQVISGIGFLGAGTIMREGVNVRGLTTAASLWVVSGIGLAIGAGFYGGAVLTTVFAVATLILLEYVERRYISSKVTALHVTTINQPGKLGHICQTVGNAGVNIKNLEMEIDDSKNQAHVIITIDTSDIPREKLIDELINTPGVIGVRTQ